MEKINGISFEDYALAAANLATGMSEEEVCQVLGIEVPVWAETLDLWSAKLADLMAEDMEVATQYGAYFQNPKQGKFATANSSAESLEDTLKKVPDFDTYKKIFWHQSKAAEVGIDAVSIIEQYDLTLQSWSAVGQHYAKMEHSLMDEKHDKETLKSNYKALTDTNSKWESYWDNHFANNKADLAGDISF